jgi:tRNA modification GTPase
MRKPASHDCVISAHTGEGIDALEHQIKNLYLDSGAEESAPLCLINARQNTCLENATHALSQAQTGLAYAIDPEIIAQDLRIALSEVDEILGVTDHEEILDKIFAQFCIGK